MTCRHFVGATAYSKTVPNWWWAETPIYPHEAANAEHDQQVPRNGQISLLTSEVVENHDTRSRDRGPVAQEVDKDFHPDRVQQLWALEKLCRTPLANGSNPFLCRPAVRPLVPLSSIYGYENCYSKIKIIRLIFEDKTLPDIEKLF